MASRQALLQGQAQGFSAAPGAAAAQQRARTVRARASAVSGLSVISPKRELGATRTSWRPAREERQAKRRRERKDAYCARSVSGGVAENDRSTSRALIDKNFTLLWILRMLKNQTTGGVFLGIQDFQNMAESPQVQRNRRDSRTQRCMWMECDETNEQRVKSLVLACADRS